MITVKEAKGSTHLNVYRARSIMYVRNFLSSVKKCLAVECVVYVRTPLKTMDFAQINAHEP